ncbi:hypothetical protein [Paenibacillus flagellatus]|uniref:CBM-cenC domain-containing protein n=1 Tax=Paenibacillus flagellatus TaxID=2211139 RepID=A0A2V5KCN6_9BACL|nr:hypothetical protein [Paenibacillus flagellatus]PYI57389.1 hypothetical protein DLM86_02830 [Paenibacillus flagellatus]
MRHAAAAGDTIVPNARFEEGLTGWTVPGGEKSATVVGAEAEAGAPAGRALRLAADEAATGGGAGTFAESARVPAGPGRTYYAYAACRPERDTGGAVALRFYDGAGRPLAAEAAAVPPMRAGAGMADGGWRTIAAAATAPEGTAALAVVLRADPLPAGGDVRFGDVRVTAKHTALGAQVTNATIHAAAVGRDAAGRATVYAVADGSAGCCARLVAIDPNDGSTVGVWELPGAAGGWSAVAANDGSVYAGSYENGLLYRYVPGEPDITVVGKPREGEMFVYGLAAGAGSEIYGGTYPGAMLFRYSPDEGFAQLGPAPLQPGESYVRDVAFDAERGAVYAGIGSHASLKRLDARTGAVTDWLAEELRGEQFVYDVNVAAGKLFVRATPSCRTYVCGLEGDESGLPAVEATIDGVHSLGVSPEYDGGVYYGGSGGLWRYDVAARRSEPTGVADAMTLDQFVVRLDDQTNFPGYTLVGIGSANGRTRLTKYNAATGKLASLELSFPEAPANLVSIVHGPDSRLYTSGFLVGGHGVYTPMRDDETVQRRGVMQSENMAELDGKLYFGVYPGARLYEYDPGKPWTADRGGDNPRLLFALKDEEQDRPFGMAADGGKLYVGTVSGYGKLGGALTVYDPASGTFDFYRHAVPNQSLIALACRDGIVYAGSSIWGGIGIEPSETEAKLLRFDSATREFAVLSLPVPGLKAVTALAWATGGLLWGMAEGYLFGFDPQSRTFVHFEEAFPDVKYGERFVWRDATLLEAADGRLYGTVGGRYVFRFDPAGRRIETIRDDGGKFLAEDDYGHLYYVVGTELYRLVP